MFIKLSEIVPQYFNKYNLSDTAKAAQVVDFVNQILKEQFEKEAQALTLKDMVLTIGVSSNAVAQEIQMGKLALLDQLKERFEEERVKDLRFKVQKAESC
ncbi:MAG: DUF721 domain-containing protein [Candidatus Gracilibacteria bacterium]|nr:DUF721 domain-containing protein [Candidatus Gracilibacteria bacterium]